MPALRSLGHVRGGWPRPLFAARGTVFGRAEIDDVDALVAIPFDPARPEKPLTATRVIDSLNRLDSASGSASGHVAFTVTSENQDLYRLRFDRNTKISTGRAERVTFEPSAEFYGSLSADGRFLAFLSDRGGARAAWVRDLASGQDRMIDKAQNLLLPISMSPDGNHVAYFATDRKLTVAPVAGGPAVNIGSGYAHIWWIRPDVLAAARLTSNYDSVQEVHISLPAPHVVWEGNRWSLEAYCSTGLNFQWCYARKGDEIRLSTRAPGAPQARENLIAVSPLWSTFSFPGESGDTLYWHSREQGADVVMARRINPTTEVPVGAAFLSHRFNGPARVAPRGHHPGEMRNGSFLVTMSESNSNIWLQTLPD